MRMPTNADPNTLENRVKRAILITYGHNAPDPSLLKNDKSMDDFNLTTAQKLALTASFNQIAVSIKPTAIPIGVGAVANCDTVQDCIDLVLAVTI